MKNFVMKITFAALFLLSGNAFALDCPSAPWVQSGTCSQLGLDTNRGVCLPGDRYETKCDDHRNSRGQVETKTCQGTRLCRSNNNDRDRDRDCSRWYRGESCYDLGFWGEGCDGRDYCEEKGHGRFIKARVCDDDRRCRRRGGRRF